MPNKILKARDGKLYTMRPLHHYEGLEACIIYRILSKQNHTCCCSDIKNNLFGVNNYPKCSCYKIVFVEMKGGI